MTEQELMSMLEDKEAELSFQKRNVKNLTSSLDSLRASFDQQAHILRKEEQDLLDLERVSVSNLFNKLLGKMDEIERKEEQERLEAKIRYDELQNALHRMEADKRRAQSDLSALEREYSALQEKGRMQFPSAGQRYKEREQEIVQLKSQAKELNEAMDSGNRVIEAVHAALGKLEAARGWATFDMFSRGGLISHMAKYGNIDEAQAIINQIGYLLDRFQAELTDVDISFRQRLDGYDTATRFVDLFFDNIFTDLSVRSRIANDMTQLHDLKDSISTVLHTLDISKREILARVADLETRII